MFTSKKQKIIFYSLLASIFAILLVIATIFDYQITDLLAKKWLVNGAYYSTNKFARFFEYGGEMIIYWLVVAAATILIFKANDNTNKTTRIISKIGCAIIDFGMSLFQAHKFYGYIEKLNPDLALFDGLASYAFEGLVAILFSLCFYFIIKILIKKEIINKDLLNQLALFSIFTIFVAIFSQLFVQVLKLPVGRERYRALYHLSYLGVDSQGYTPWYVFNGSCGAIADSFDPSLGVKDDYFKSFPSGHTCAAAMSYVFMYIPFFFTKSFKKSSKILFIVLPILFTGTVAFSRLVMGAHFMSDVLVGGTTTFVCTILAFYLTKSKLISNLYTNFFN